MSRGAEREDKKGQKTRWKDLLLLRLTLQPGLATDGVRVVVGGIPNAHDPLSLSAMRAVVVRGTVEGRTVCR